MTQALWTAVDRYFTDLLVSSDPALETLPRLAAEGLGPFDLVFIAAVPIRKGSCGNHWINGK